MIDPTVLGPLFAEAFSRQITFVEAASRYPVSEWIETFQDARAGMQEVLDGLTDAQAAYADPNNPLWSVSETITHLAFTQNLHYNLLLDQAPNQLPHMAESPRGAGEGSRPNVPVAELRTLLAEATERIQAALAATHQTHDPQKMFDIPIFGRINYAGLLLILTAHELDHLRQTRLMRRIAKAN